MNIDRLNQTDSLALLKACCLGRLGCIADGLPYVVPINYYFDGDDIYSHATPGKKIDAMRSNPRVCLQVDDIKDSYNWRSVIAYGTYEEISDEAEQAKIMEKLFARVPDMTPVESRQSIELKTIVVFRIKLDKITGRGEYW